METSVNTEDAKPARLRMAGRMRVLATIALGTAAAAPAQASGQLVLIPDLNLLVGMIVGFVLLIFPVNALIFKPIFQALDERAARISGARDRAAHIQREADSILARYEARIRDARSEADDTRKEQLGEARDEHASLTSAAREEAERQIDQARTALAGGLSRGRETLRASSRELARAAAESILGRSIS